MKKILTFLGFFCCIILTAGQNQTADKTPVRTVTDKGVKGLKVEYTFNGYSISVVNENSTKFVRINIKDFTFLKEVGKPALPAHYDLVLIPDDATARVNIKYSNVSQQGNLLVYPALRPATDRYGDPEPRFEIDSAFYLKNTWYPEEPVRIVNILKIKGLSLAVVRVCPVQYNPRLNLVKFIGSLNYEVKFSKSKSLIKQKNFYSSYFLSNLDNLVLNNSSIKQETEAYYASLKNVKPAKLSDAKNYIIITHSDYREAADSLAKWKSQLGYAVKIISRSSWTSAQVKTEIHGLYQSYAPRPDYFVIIGDHDKVPGEIHQDPMYHENFATDLYYACMDGPSDYVADMAFGRISVSSAAQSMTVVKKIIKYEKSPPALPGFYTRGTGCAYFQDYDTSNYEDRRFVLTMEEIHSYMQSQGYSVDRVYEADPFTNPMYYNNGFYANSEPLPVDLLRSSGFAWDGDKNDIVAALNSTDGRLFLAHRDHGYTGGTGWASPEFTSNDIGLLNNGDKLPVVFSINCHTGEYRLPECFAEKFLRKTNGGAVGVFGAAYYSYSGYNDGLIEGMFDAIWSNPGLIPDYTGIGDTPVGSPVSHQPIYTMGDVMNQGLIRMVQTWGDDQYSHELFHYFGDPAMKIWTALPEAITATNDPTLDCHDTTFQINSCSCTGCLATLVVDGEMIASDTLGAGPNILRFAPVAGNSAVLTISGHNYRPYIYSIPFTSSCIKPKFDIEYANPCVGQQITINNASTGNIQTFAWDFGSGASPQTASNSGPFQVYYSFPGLKYITLTISDGTNSETYADSVYIEQPCVYSAIQNQHIMINSCQGTLFDNNGTGNYLPNSNDTVTILVPGATSINLHFTDFDVEMGDAGYCNWDYLQIFDGVDMSAPLIGKYCSLQGFTPAADVSSSGNAITVYFYADEYTEGRGYEIDFNCSASGQVPSAGFTADPLTSCDGTISFTDLSTNSPTKFHWDFGDGDTSNTQNPVHIYQSNGNYTVTFKVFNNYGDNTFVRANYISIHRPDVPSVINDTICGPAEAQLSVSSNGTNRWFNEPQNGSPIHVGDNYNTGVIDTTTTYYVESAIDEVYTIGAPDTLIGSGGYYTGSSNHYMIFDCMVDILLVSVDVYAQTTGSRTIRLKTHGGTVVYDTVINLSAGKTTINLNWNIPAASNYGLEAMGPDNKLFRNILGGNYPYIVNDLIKITGNSYSNNDYYYFFYNWKVQAEECKSPRIPVVAYVYTSNPAAGYISSSTDNNVAFTNTSMNAYSYFWDFNDGGFSVDENPLHTFMNNGAYIVSMTAFNACGTDTFQDTVNIYCVGINDTDNIQGLSISPNPAVEYVMISWYSKYVNTGFIDVNDIFGQTVMCKKVNIVEGINKNILDVRNLSQGVYFVKLIANGQKTLIKLTIL